MRIALGADEPYPVHATLADLLRRRGHEVVPFGAIVADPDGPSEAPFVDVAEAVAREVASGRCDQAVLLCWTGTGVAIAANKVPGIRAALCTDAQTAAGARVWNDANVLCLSNRLLSGDVAAEILAGWFEPGALQPGDPARGAGGVAALVALDARYRG
ncbi:MAG: RpiB/LacA/LacB family sugar-phosphate isomerase [Myxococcota bacterium]